MRKLLYAELLRLKRSLVFWLFVAMSFVLGMISVFVFYNNGGEYSSGSWEQSFYLYGAIAIVLSAVFIGVYLGSEHEKTMRNKIVVGCRRSDIYSSLLIAVIIAMTAFIIAYSASVVAIGIPLSCYRARRGYDYFAWDEFSLSENFALTVFVIVCLQIAYASIYTAITMNARNKGISIVAALVGTLLLLAACFFLDNRIEDLRHSNSTYFPYGNQAFLQMLIAIQNFLPTGQSLMLLGSSQDLSWVNSLLSLIVVIVATALGVKFFHKRDLN